MADQSIKLKLSEVAVLAAELQHLLSLKMKGTLKFEFKSFSKQFIEEVKSIEEIRNDLFKKYGNEIEPDKWQIKDEEKENFTQEWKELLETEKSFQYTPMKYSWFENLEIEPDYDQVFKFVEKDESNK